MTKKSGEGGVGGWGGIHLRPKIKDTSFLIKHSKIQAKDIRFPISHSQPISHTST